MLDCADPGDLGQLHDPGTVPQLGTRFKSHGHTDTTVVIIGGGISGQLADDYTAFSWPW